MNANTHYRSDGRYVAPLLALAALATWSNEAVAQCKADNECWHPRVCREGRCVEPAKCENDLDCPRTDRCVQWKCRLRPEANGPGSEESPAPPPVPATPVLGGIGESCRARADCQSGLKCISQTCQHELYGLPCGTDSQCGDNLRCVQGVCGGPNAAPTMAPMTQPGVAQPGAQPVVQPPPVQPRAGVAQPGLAQPGHGPSPDAAPSEWMSFDPFDGDLHGHAGLVIAPGATHALGGGGGITGFSFLFGVKRASSTAPSRRSSSSRRRAGWRYCCSRRCR